MYGSYRKLSVKQFRYNLQDVAYSVAEHNVALCLVTRESEIKIIYPVGVEPRPCATESRLPQPRDSWSKKILLSNKLQNKH